MSTLGLQSKLFSDKVTLANQTNSKTVSMSIVEARNLHNEIVGLLAKIAELVSVSSQQPASTTIEMSGGKF